MKRKQLAQKVARMGVLVALAMIFSYIEVLIPFQIGIPGAKLGIANLVVLVALYQCSAKEAFLISMVRIFLMCLLFGNILSGIYSLSGGVLSFLVMWLAKKSNWFSEMGVSIAGGVAHNVGQLGAAVLVLQTVSIVGYLPVLLIAGLITGAMIGVVGKKLTERISVFAEVEGRKYDRWNL